MDLRKIITENYCTLKSIALKSVKGCANKQLIEDIYHDVLISMLKNYKDKSLTLKECQAYVYKSVQTSYRREFLYARSLKYVDIDIF